MSTYKLGVVADPDEQADGAQGPVRPRLQERDRRSSTRSSRTSSSATAPGQPVLVGTTSVEKSEYLSRLLAKKGVKHEVLNAKNHAREAAIVAQAGRLGAVTVATNMAGRGTDIMLGGNAEFLAVAQMHDKGLSPVETPDEYEAAWDDVFDVGQGARRDRRPTKVVEAGGLYVLGTERHESRRIDNQLRGRSGRQGDPGESRFYLSLDRRPDAPVQRRCRRGPAWAARPDDMAIESKIVSRAIRSRAVAGRVAQRRDPQERAQVRRRPEPPARGDLQRPPPHPRGRRPARPRAARSSRTSSPRSSTSTPADGQSDDWDFDALWTELKTLYPVGDHDRRGRQRGRQQGPAQRRRR